MKPIFQWLSPGGKRARLSLVIFHRVLPQPDPLLPDELDAAHFDRICAWLAHWFRVLPLDQAAQQLREGSLPARALAITFDDGYADNHDIALPILQRHGLCATFFIATDFIDGGCMWNDIVIDAVRGVRGATVELGGLAEDLPESMQLGDLGDRQHAVTVLLDRLKYLPPKARQHAVHDLFRRCAPGRGLPRPMMTSSQVRALYSAGMQLGAHTCSHPILAGLDDASARHEIEQGKRALEAMIDTPIKLFAYPNGRPNKDYTAATVDMVREAGFDAAVSTAWGAARSGGPMFEIPRFTPWDRRRLKFGLRLAANFRVPLQAAL